MLKRVISSVIAFPILIFFLYTGGTYLTVATFAVSLIMLYEYYHSTGIINVFTMAGGAMCAIYLYRFGFEWFELYLTILMFLFLMTGLKSRKLDIRSIGIFLISVFYIVVPVYLLDLIAKSDYPRMMWLVFIIAWGSDTCAYFVGRTFGKTPLAPTISPKKTVAGSVGGIVGATLASALFYWLLGFQTMTGFGIFITFAFFAAILSQIGDLIASGIKRAFGIKDFGKIMPGHGGLLDRFDSVIILIPLFYGFIALL